MRDGSRTLSPWRTLAAAAALAGVMIAPFPQPARAEARDRPASAAPSDLTSLLALFQSSATSPESRLSAATALLNDGRVSAKAALHEGLLSDEPPGVRLAAATAIARHPAPPRDLVPALAAALDPSDAASAGTILQALSKYRTREAIRPIITRVLGENAGADAELRFAAMRTLVAQTGNEDFGDSASRWRAWWGEVQMLPEAEFRLRIADTLAKQSGVLRRQRDELSSRLIDAYRRLHSSMNEAERGTLLTELLRSELPDLRSLGLDLTRRALLNAQRLGEPVVLAVAARLTDPSAGIRAEAAGILQKLDRPDLAPSIAAALDAEPDPAAAAGMLGALARRPQPGTLDMILRWMSAAGPARDTALGAALALEQAGLLPDDAARRTLLSAVEALKIEDVTPDSVRLQARLGGADRAKPYLASERAPIALAAAGALADSPATLDAVIDAARANPGLFEPAVRGLMRWRPTVDGLALARSLPAPETRLAESLFSAYTRAIPPGQLLNAAFAESDELRRLGLLAPIATSDYISNDGDERSHRVQLIGEYAETNFALGRAAETLAALDLIRGEPSAAGFGPMRLSTLLWLGRVEEAADLARERPMPAYAWLDGLEKSLGTAHAASVLAAAEIDMPGPLTPQNDLRFSTLRERVMQTSASPR